MRVVRNAIEELEGITNATEAQVIELMERDMNGLDADRFSVEGVYQTVVNIDPNRRRSSPWNYITETLEATNENGDSLYPLKLSTSSLATRVLFAKCSGKPKAVGVEYLVGQGLYEADQRYDPSDEAELRTVHARKEVIIAGGSFNTPQILKLSGIGPRSELEKHGIPVLVDLPAVVSHLGVLPCSYILIIRYRANISATITRQASTSKPVFPGRTAHSPTVTTRSMEQRRLTRAWQSG